MTPVDFDFTHLLLGVGHHARLLMGLLSPRAEDEKTTVTVEETLAQPRLPQAQSIEVRAHVS